MQKYDVVAHSSAEAPAVYAVLLEGATWPIWSPIDSFELEGGGSPDGPQGVGAIRVFRTGRNVSREQIVELTQDRHMGYVMLPGGLLRDYRGDIDLTPDPSGGTGIRWHATFNLPIFGTGWLLKRYLSGYMQLMADSLAKYTERQAGTRGLAVKPKRGRGHA